MEFLQQNPAQLTPTKSNKSAVQARLIVNNCMAHHREQSPGKPSCRRGFQGESSP
jgi:hypothetical protein